MASAWLPGRLNFIIIGGFSFTQKMCISSHVLSKEYQKTVSFKDHPWIVVAQHVTCFMSRLHLEFSGGSKIFGRICVPLIQSNFRSYKNLQAMWWDFWIEFKFPSPVFHKSNKFTLISNLFFNPMPIKGISPIFSLAVQHNFENIHIFKMWV